MEKKSNISLSIILGKRIKLYYYCYCEIRLYVLKVTTINSESEQNVQQLLPNRIKPEIFSVEKLLFSTFFKDTFAKNFP